MNLVLPPLRVSFLSNAREVWGAERSVLNLAPHLQSLGVHVSLACPPGAFAAAAEELGVRHVPLELPLRGGPRNGPIEGLLRDARGVPAGIARIIRATRGADVVHCNTLLMHPDAVLAGRILRRPTVIELHDITPSGPSQQLLSTITWLSSGAVSISNAASDAVRGPGRRKVQLMPQGVDADLFQPGPRDAALRQNLAGPEGDDDILVGIVGRVDPGKGVDVLVKAAAIADPRIRVVVVGAPELDNGACLREVLQLGQALLGERFRYAGTTTDVPATLRCLDVLVNASEAEPFGLTLLEAQACAIPVVGTNAGGVPDFIEDHRNGLLVRPNDVTDLAAALSELAADTSLRKQLAKEGLADVQTRYNIRVRAESLAALYRTVATRIR